MPRVLPRVFLALVLVIVALTINISAPAWACACGAYVPDTSGPVVVDEQALIRWDGTTEDIVMGLGVEGASEKAAWIMPVPTRAEVSLADPGLFDELEHLTRPKIRYDDKFWPDGIIPMLGAGGDGAGGPGSGPGVEVRGQQRLGPFEVVRLGAKDPKAVTDWLGKEGFPLPPTLTAGLAPYIEEGWEIVAIRLAPAEGDELGGRLQPLRLTFPAEKAVYPMRLSRAATRPQSVGLYVLAPHKATVSPASYQQPPTRRFAGWVAPGPEVKLLAPFIAGERMFLTRYDNVINFPRSITDDYEFGKATSNAAYRQTVIIDRDRFRFVGPTLVALFVLAAILLVVVAVRGRRGRMAR